MALKLNSEQKKAIEHKTGPLLIIAGAGTGKTTVITERIKYLIKQKLAKPEEILALTFTEKGATDAARIHRGYVRVLRKVRYGETVVHCKELHEMIKGDERAERAQLFQITF